MECFIRTLSPVKKAINSEYFHCTLQTENAAVRAVCFSPEKHEKFKTCEENKSPIRLENFKPPEEGRDLIVSKFTRITPLVQDQVKFKYSEQATALPTMNNIASVHEVAKEQMVNI